MANMSTEPLTIWLIASLFLLYFLAVVLVYRAETRQGFLKQHGENIRQQNRQLAEEWRASNPDEEFLIIDRTFQPPGWLAPKIRIRQRFRRDQRPWWVRLLSL